MTRSGYSVNRNLLRERPPASCSGTRVKRTGGAALAAAVVLGAALAACSSPPNPVTPATTGPSPAATALNAQTAAATAVPTTARPLPARADQDAATRAQLEDWYLATTRDVTTVGATSDAQLLTAAATVCDALDAGSSFKLAYALTAPQFADDADWDAPIGAAVAAVRSICPEHEGKAQ